MGNRRTRARKNMGATPGGLLAVVLILVLALTFGVVATQPDAQQPAEPAPGGGSFVEFDESTARLTSQDAYTTIYTDANGVNRADISFLPERVQVGGAWVPVSSELHVDGRGGVKAPLDPLKPVFHVVATDDAAVTLSYDEQSLAVGFVGLEGAQPTVAEHETLGSENEVIYPGALGGSDVVFSLDQGTLRQAVVLEQAPGAEQPRFEFVIMAPDLEVRENDFGTIEFVDATGEVAFSVLRPVMWDSSGDSGYANSETLAVAHTFESRGDGRWVMVLEPDLEWLNAEERVYPIYVDPTTSYGAINIYTYKEGSGSTNFGAPVMMGNSKQNSTCCAWRTVYRINLNGLFGYRVTGGLLYGSWLKYTTNLMGGGLFWATSFSFGGYGSSLGNFNMATSLNDWGSAGFNAATAIVHSSDLYSYNMLIGEETNSIYSLKQISLGITVVYVTKHTINSVTGPENGENHVVAPTVSATGSVYSGGTQLFRYVFASTNGGTNFTSPYVVAGPYKVPDGVLTPGKHYNWTVQSIDNLTASPTVTSGTRNFTMEAAPGVPTNVKVDGQPLTQDVTSTSTRPVVSAVVSDPVGGQVRALFTVKQDGIVIMDSVPGSWVDLNGPGPYVSSQQLPYALVAGSDYTIEVVGFDGHMRSATSTAPPWKFYGPPRQMREIPGNDDANVGAVS